MNGDGSDGGESYLAEGRLDGWVVGGPLGSRVDGSSDGHEGSDDGSLAEHFDGWLVKSRSRRWIRVLSKKEVLSKIKSDDSLGWKERLKTSLLYVQRSL